MDTSFSAEDEPHLAVVLIESEETLQNRRHVVFLENAKPNRKGSFVVHLAVLILKSHNQTLRNKIDELIICGVGKSEVDEIQAILTEAEDIRKAQEEVDHDDIKSLPMTEEELENSMSEIKDITREVRDLNKRVDDFEEKFLNPPVHVLHLVSRVAARLLTYSIDVRQ
ncbi:hypothetical protein TIFTF001_012584 [Ficus carica]|uniref:Uncharacterized protein n=1 Tax=Ficus carica TaxID=3494 RepID=A0AA88A0L0_FICCA|nr:hypothetical protein TIFTF001_012584 [Ficus carica]